jgi:AcrR family transcriptional regulator
MGVTQKAQKRTVKTGGRKGSDAPRTRPQGQATIAAVLTAAGEIASKEGLEQVSMRRLASAARMSKSGLYAHFRSKEELQLATIEHFLETFEAMVVRGPPDEPDARLGALLERWLVFYERRVYPGGCLLITAAVEFAGRRGPVRDALEAGIDREIAALEAAVQRANETGEVRPERDVSQTAFELHSILMNANALFQVKRDPESFEWARAAIRGVLNNPGRRNRRRRPSR